jgi:hypothetical protein
LSHTISRRRCVTPIRRYFSDRHAAEWMLNSGLRRSLVMSVSSEGGEGAGGVAGVLAYGGGEVD